MARKKQPRFDLVKEVKRRARATVGAPPPERVADPQEKRRRQAQKPKHKPSLGRLLEQED